MHKCEIISELNKKVRAVDGEYVVTEHLGNLDLTIDFSGCSVCSFTDWDASRFRFAPSYFGVATVSEIIENESDDERLMSAKVFYEEGKRLLEDPVEGDILDFLDEGEE